MYHWYPKTKLENAVVNYQPNHDFIFGKLSETEPEHFTYQRPKSHLDYAEKKLQRKSNAALNPKLDVITKVQNITGVKPLGELPSVNDWDTSDTLEQETIGMMRHIGLEPSIDIPFNENCTISTQPIPNDIEYMRSRNRVIPIFFNQKYFKFQPKKNIDCINIDSTTNTEKLIEKIENSDQNNLDYSPIIDVTTTSTPIENNSTINSDSIQYMKLKDTSVNSDNNLIEKKWSHGIFGNNVTVKTKSYNSKKQKSQKKYINNNNIATGKSTNSSTNSESSYKTAKSTLSAKEDPSISNIKNQIPKKGKNTNPLCAYDQLYTSKEIYDLKRDGSLKNNNL